MAEVVKFNSIYRMADDRLEEAAGDIYRIVTAEKRLLIARHLFGIVRRHSKSPKASYEHLHKHAEAGRAILKAGDEPSPAALIETENGIVGMANAMDLSLRKQSNSLPPRISRFAERAFARFDPAEEEGQSPDREAHRRGRVTLAEAERTAAVADSGPNVAVYATDQLALRDGYHYLRALCQEIAPGSEPWTIEPYPDDRQSVQGQAQTAVHEAIRDAGYVRKGHGYYDDQESGRHAVPDSVLYAGELHDARMVG